MDCHIIMTAYMDDDMDDGMGDDITIPIHLLTAKHQRWAIFSLFSAHLQSILSPFTFWFQPILNLFLQPIITPHTTNGPLL